jgi:hypothetical protein
MILNVVNAENKEGYKIFLEFNNNESVMVDLQPIIYSDHRKIFEPLRDVEYFRTFNISLNTITWDNEADFAPEFLLELGKAQKNKKLSLA